MSGIILPQLILIAVINGNGQYFMARTDHARVWNLECVRKWIECEGRKSKTFCATNAYAKICADLFPKSIYRIGSFLGINNYCSWLQ